MAARSPSSVEYRSTALDQNIPVTPGTPLPVTASGDVASGTADSGNAVKVGGVFNSTLPTLANGQRGDLQMTSRGQTLVTLGFGTQTMNVGSLTAAGVSIGSFGWGYTGAAAYVYNGGQADLVVKANSASRLLSSAATTNATVAKASAGNMYKIYGNNTVAVKKYLKIFNKATTPVPGTDTPILTLVLLPSAAFTYDFGSFGEYFSAGISYAITAAAADADATAIGAGDIECMNLIFA